MLKQSSFGLPGQYGRRVTRVNSVRTLEIWFYLNYGKRKGQFLREHNVNRDYTLGNGALKISSIKMHVEMYAQITKRHMEVPLRASREPWLYSREWCLGNFILCTWRFGHKLRQGKRKIPLTI